MDLRTFFNNYPLWARYPEADVYHLTSQNLASLLVFRQPAGRTVVTVHDIIPYMLRDDARLSPYRGKIDRWFDAIAMSGLRRADRLVADSHYTQRCLMSELNIPEWKIEVVHLGIDHSRFRPLNVPADFRARYALPDDRQYLIYVGSEDPRKNLGTLVHAVAGLRGAGHNIDLLKVGRAHFEVERERLTALARRLGLEASVHFLDDVSEADLAILYNLADICVMPSLYEGFGFPVLEAMACGTPVVCSEAASLPELVGDAALLFGPGPDSDRNLARVIESILEDRDLRSKLDYEGRARAGMFTWKSTTERMMGVYRDLASVSSPTRAISPEHEQS